MPTTNGHTSTSTNPRDVIALGYARRSKESGERTVSLEVQHTRIEAYAAEHGWRLVEVLTDDGVSGGKRSRLNRLEAAVREHHARAVVTYHLDRYARDVAALLDSIRDYHRRGVELHAVGRGHVEVQTASGYLGVAIEGVLAEHLRKVISEKTRDALARLRSKGRRVSGHLPFGYRLAGDGITLEAEPQEQAALMLIRALAPGRSLRALAAELAARGVLARNGQRFAPQTLARLRAVTDRAVGDNTSVDACAVSAT